MTDRTANTAMQVRENGLVSQSGGLLLAETLRATGLGQGPAGWLARWRAPRAVHDPGKILTDLAMASELLAWMQMLALDGPARAWEPKRLRLRLFSAAGRLARSGRRLRLRLAATWPWATQLTTAITRTRRPSRLADHHESAPATRKDKPSARGTPPTRRDSREAPARPGAEDQQTAAVPTG
jgi:hypothetical protein